MVPSIGGNAVWAAEENSGVDEPSGWVSDHRIAAVVLVALLSCCTRDLARTCMMMQDIIDLRFSYDNATDTLYGGINTGVCFTGDTDCDGTDGACCSSHQRS